MKFEKYKFTDEDGEWENINPIAEVIIGGLCLIMVSLVICVFIL